MSEPRARCSFSRRETDAPQSGGPTEGAGKRLYYLGERGFIAQHPPWNDATFWESYGLDRTIRLDSSGIEYGEPGASLTLVGVTVYTYSLFWPSAYK
jgi:hypothetical protein